MADKDDFWPEDTDDTFYLVGYQSITDVLDSITAKWGSDVNLSDVVIRGEFFLTSRRWDRFVRIDRLR